MGGRLGNMSEMGQKVGGWRYGIGKRGLER